MKPDELYEIYREAWFDYTAEDVPLAWSDVGPAARRAWSKVSIAIDEELTEAEDHGYADGYADGEDDNS